MKAKTPIRATKKEVFSLWVYSIIRILLTVFLIITVVHLICYYVFLIQTKGFYDEDSIQICIYIIIGTYLSLFIHRDQVKKIFKVKK